MTLPLELHYHIMKFLSPFDIINFSNALCIDRPCDFNENMYKHINKLSNHNQYYKKILTDILHDIITHSQTVNHDIINIIDDICYIIKRSYKYMDILGFTGYLFKIENGKYNKKEISYSIIDNMQVHYIKTYDIDLLKIVLKKYINLIEKEDNIFFLRTYKVKELLRIKL